MFTVTIFVVVQDNTTTNTINVITLAKIEIVDLKVPLQELTTFVSANRYKTHENLLT